MAEKENMKTVDSVEAKDNIEIKAEKPTASKRQKPSQLEKECDVLVYNAAKESIIISFDGFGYEFKNVTKDPGKNVSVKYSGKIGTPNFKLELK